MFCSFYFILYLFLGHLMFFNVILTCLAYLELCLIIYSCKLLKGFLESWKKISTLNWILIGKSQIQFSWLNKIKTLDTKSEEKRHIGRERKLTVGHVRGIQKILGVKELPFMKAILLRCFSTLILLEKVHLTLRVWPVFLLDFSFRSIKIDKL